MTDKKYNTSKSVKESGVNDDEDVLKNSDQPIAKDAIDDNTRDINKKIDKEKDTESRDYLH